MVSTSSPSILMVNQATEDPSNYYTNYWLETTHHNLEDATQHPSSQLAPPTYISLQQPSAAPAVVDQPPMLGYDYSYAYGAFDIRGSNQSEEMMMHHQPQQDELTKLTPLHNKNSSPISRPLTTSHHVQQLSSLCPPFSDQDSTSTSDIGCPAVKETIQKLKPNRKLQSVADVSFFLFNFTLCNVGIVTANNKSETNSSGRKSSAETVGQHQNRTRLKRKPRVLFSQVL